VRDGRKSTNETVGGQQDSRNLNDTVYDSRVALISGALELPCCSEDEVARVSAVA
jgi:hypothetical protein